MTSAGVADATAKAVGAHVRSPSPSEVRQCFQSFGVVDLDLYCSPRRGLGVYSPLRVKSDCATIGAAGTATDFTDLDAKKARQIRAAGACSPRRRSPSTPRVDEVAGGSPWRWPPLAQCDGPEAVPGVAEEADTAAAGERLTQQSGTLALPIKERCSPFAGDAVSLSCDGGSSVPISFLAIAGGDLCRPTPSYHGQVASPACVPRSPPGPSEPGSFAPALMAPSTQCSTRTSSRRQLVAPGVQPKAAQAGLWRGIGPFATPRYPGASLQSSMRCSLSARNLLSPRSGSSRRQQHWTAPVVEAREFTVGSLVAQ